MSIKNAELTFSVFAVLVQDETEAVIFGVGGKSYQFELAIDVPSNRHYFVPR